MKKHRLLKAVIITAAVLFVLLVAGGIAFSYIGTGAKKNPDPFPAADYDVEGTPMWDLQIANIEKLGREAAEWDNPAAHEIWEQTSFDGIKLYAQFFKNGNSHTYLLFCHGYGDAVQRFYNYTHKFYLRGMNVLMPVLRGHAPSGGKSIGMGWNDSRDILGWVNMIVDKDPQAQIALVGVSMGGASVMMASGLDLPSNVKCIVEDSGFSGVMQVFSYQIRYTYHLPVFPFINFASIANKIINGWSFSEANTAVRLANAKVPMLFIHGMKDVKVPGSMLEDNVQAYKGPHSEVLTFEDTGHIKAYFTYPEIYFPKVEEFIGRYCTLSK